MATVRVDGDTYELLLKLQARMQLERAEQVSMDDVMKELLSTEKRAPQNREKNAEPGARRSKMSPEERKIQLEKIRLMRETLECLKRIEGRLKNWG